jgi:hypothetical protein
LANNSKRGPLVVSQARHAVAEGDSDATALIGLSSFIKVAFLLSDFVFLFYTPFFHDANARPVADSEIADISSGFPSATIDPPCTPPPGPRSMTQSDAATRSI